MGTLNEELMRGAVLGRREDTPDIRVPFGDLPNQVLPLDWAEAFIRIVYAEHPGVFRAILPRLYGLQDAQEPKRRRS